jgi:hypothetical protein
MCSKTAPIFRTLDFRSVILEEEQLKASYTGGE